eukprot:2664344-Prymnesium_polylepis.1
MGVTWGSHGGSVPWGPCARRGTGGHMGVTWDWWPATEPSRREEGRLGRRISGVGAPPLAGVPNIGAQHGCPTLVPNIGAQHWCPTLDVSKLGASRKPRDSAFVALLSRTHEKAEEVGGGGSRAWAQGLLSKPGAARGAEAEEAAE